MNEDCIFGVLDLIEETDNATNQDEACRDYYKQRKLLLPLIDQRYRVAERLGSKLRSRSKNARIFAAVLLGLYRLERAVEPLADHIEVEEDRYCRSPPQHLWARFPASKALVEIGRESVEPSITHLLYETDEHRRDLFVEVIQGVLGSEQAVRALELANAPDLSPWRKEKLADALARMKKKTPAGVP
jgi:hypothetical protein